MRHILILLLGALIAYGQSLTVSCPNGVQRPGTSVTCALTLTNGPSPASALQWQATLTGIAGVGVTQAVAGTASAAGKTVTYNTVIATLWSNSRAVIGSGTVATMTLALPNVTGTLNIGLTGQLGSSAAGDKITVTANPPVSVSVQSECDINGDGQTNLADVTAYNAGILAGSIALPDLDGDGARTVVDLQRVSNAAGGVCRVGL